MKPHARHWFGDAFHPTYAGHMKMADFWLETVAAEFAAGKGAPARLRSDVPLTALGSAASARAVSPGDAAPRSPLRALRARFA